MRFPHIFHTGEYTKPVYENKLSEELALPLKHETRTCRKCGKTQWLDVYCLGLNPPRYVKSWFNVV